MQELLKKLSESSPIGLHRHFKGGYYYVKDVAKDCSSEELSLIYFDVLHPEAGVFKRTLSDFFSVGEEDNLIKDREDNITGQSKRFEKVLSLTNEVKNLSTEALIRELGRRKDSPLQELDIERLSKRVFCTDYIIGEKFEGENPITHKQDKGVVSLLSFDNEAEAFHYFNSKPHKSNAEVFKRTFISSIE